MFRLKLHHIPLNYILLKLDSYVKLLLNYHIINFILLFLQMYNQVRLKLFRRNNWPFNIL